MPVEYKSRFPQIVAELPAVVDAALGLEAGVIAEAAKERVPQRTGELHDAIHVDRKSRQIYSVVAGNDKAWYGHLVEHGTSHSPAEPFLVPALEANRAEVLAMVNMELKHL